MGVLFSSLFDQCNDVKNEFDESVIVKSISFGDEEAMTPVRSVSFKGRDSEPLILKSSGSGKMIIEGSISFKGRELETMLSFGSSSSDEDGNILMKGVTPCSRAADAQLSTIQQSPILDPGNPKHAAAIKLQKVYKSFRTRRKLADCAVLVEQSWWKLLDFAELKRSSVSFFDIEKHETAISRWSRARTRAAKVGKGLSKNDKAQKLALQHWLEAIDPRHRYGHNLHLYYDNWLHSQSQQPFFYWLDIGEGKEINLVDTCPRLKLQQQCIKYLGPIERKTYEVIVEDGRFFYKQTGELLNTTADAKWIFVLSTSMTLYVGKKQKGTFQHSSFLAGGATTAAGRLVIESGVLKAVWPHSGHYQPTEENFNEFISFLGENHVDLTRVKMSAMDDEECSIGKQSSSNHISCNLSEEDLAQTFSSLESDEIDVKDSTTVKGDPEVQQTRMPLEQPRSIRFHTSSGKLLNLEIPKPNELLKSSEGEHLVIGSSCNDISIQSTMEVHDEAENEAVASTKDLLELQNANQQVVEDDHVESIPEESILQRINSKKGLNSYQLGKQLSCKWTTGAGPRIGCVRDYPSGLQFQALEQVNLSPRSDNHLQSYFSPRGSSGLSPRFPSSSEEVSSPSSLMLKKRHVLQRSIQTNTRPKPRLREALVAMVTNV